MGKRKGQKPAESICWACENARPKRCAWVNEARPVWTKARRKVLMSGEALYVVQQCKNYRGGAKDDDMPGVRGQASA